MSTKKIDALIVTYNSEKYIGSLLRQLVKTGTIKEIYMLDNGSHDSTVEKAMTVKSKKINVILGKKNIGFGNAMNVLFHKSKSEYKLLLNPDTKLRKNSLKKLLKCAMVNKADIAGGPMVSMLGSQQISHTRIPNTMTVLFEFTNLKKLFPNNPWSKSFQYHDVQKDNTVREVGTISGGYMLISDNVIKKLGGFDKHYFMYLEDIDLCNQAHKHGYKVLFCPHTQIIHIGGASSSNKHKIHYKAWDRARIYYVRKNFTTPISIILEAAIRIDIAITKHKRDE